MQPVDLRLTAPPQPGVKAAASPRPADAPPGSSNSERAVPSEAELKQAIEAANLALKEISSELEFTRDAETGRTVVRVIDSGTQEVIRQFPSEEMLAIARTLDRLQGLLISQKA